MEMSARPEDALRVGDWLRDLTPDGGHRRHMPTHLDVLCGDYRRVVSSNNAAIAADEKFVAREGAMNFYTLYRAHTRSTARIETQRSTAWARHQSPVPEPGARARRQGPARQGPAALAS